MRSAAAIVLIASLTGVAHAGTVAESELPGGFANNTIGAAQSVSGYFSTNVDPNVFGSLPTATVLGGGAGNDVDFYSFCVGATSLAYFDIDNAPYQFDTVLSLFDSSGTLIGYDDDSFLEDPGTDFGYDSFLGSMILAPGTYYIAVSEFANFANGAYTGTQTYLTRPDNEFGGSAVAGATPGDSSFVYGADAGGRAPYMLNISLETPCSVVPLPTGACLGMAGLAGVALIRRRKH